MLIQQLNRTDPEKVFIVVKNAEGSEIKKDAVVQLDISTDIDGNRAVQPNSNELNAVIGLADKAIADGAFGLVQCYGYRASSIVFQTDTSIAAGVKLVAVAGQNYAQSSASGDLLLVLCESVASSSASATISKKVHIRMM